MTDSPRITDADLDRAAAELHTARMDPEREQAAVDRVWERLAAADGPHALRGCEDFRELLPDLAAGTLAAAKATLVEDHTRSCLACRRELLHLREPRAQAPEATRTTRWWGVALRVAATVVVTAGLGWSLWSVSTGYLASKRLRATVTSVDGTLQTMVEAEAELAPGAVVRAHEVLRTARDSSAFLRLDDGSVVEMAPRSRVALDANRRGTTIRLQQGNILVHAAPQHDGRLFVATADCVVAVKGTIFTVNHGLRGSRVSVVEGEVEVQTPGGRELLAPGGQTTTSPSLARTTVATEVAWSRDADEHLALLRELTRLERDMVAAADSAAPRTSTRLLDLAPADTVIYVALPNLIDGLGAAREVLEGRLAASDTLARWWDEKVEAHGVDRQLEQLLDRLEPFGDALGAEIVVTVDRDTLAGRGEPLVMATLRDPVRFRRLLEDELARARASSGDEIDEVYVVDRPVAAPADAEMIVWIAGDLALVATDREVLTRLERRVNGPRPFVGTRLHGALTPIYRDGASWVIGLDLEPILTTGNVADDDLALLEQLGIMDANTLVVERHRDPGGTPTTSAELAFERPRRGLADWLAEPGPIGGLEFVSPHASMVVGVVTRDAPDMLDDLLAALDATAPDRLTGLERAEAMLGLDLRADLVAALGAEGTLAQDGPVLPRPWWTLVLEVVDPERLQATLEHVAEVADDSPETGGLELETTTVQGRTATVVRHRATGYEVAWVIDDGYLVAGPGTAAVAHALRVRSSGVHLASSAVLRSLLPADAATDCSALAYRNLGTLVAALDGVATEAMPPQAVEVLRASSEPALYCVEAGFDRIRVSGRGSELMGIGPLAGLSQSLAGVSSAP